MLKINYNKNIDFKYFFSKFKNKLINNSFNYRFFNLKFNKKFILINKNNCNYIYLESNKNYINKFKIKKLGVFYNISNNKLIFRNYKYYQTLINLNFYANFVTKGQLISISPNVNKQTGDITQGIPKIEELLEYKFNSKINSLILPFNSYIKKIDNYIIIFSNLNLIYYKTFNKQQFNKFIKIGEDFLKNDISIKNLLLIYYNYFRKYNNTMLSITKTFEKIHYFILNSINNIYIDQNVPILSIHFQIIIKQMSGFLFVLNSGDTPFLFGEILSLECYTLLLNVFKQLKFNIPEIIPFIRGISSSVSLNNSILSSVSFQNTKNMLAKVSIKKKSDWMNSIKSNIIISNQIKLGSNFN